MERRDTYRMYATLWHRMCRIAKRTLYKDIDAMPEQDFERVSEELAREAMSEMGYPYDRSITFRFNLAKANAFVPTFAAEDHSEAKSIVLAALRGVK
jgi:hypothetical protein